jgi:hypothetical protein
MVDEEDQAILRLVTDVKSARRGIFLNLEGEINSTNLCNPRCAFRLCYSFKNFVKKYKRDVKINIATS